MVVNSYEPVFPQLALLQYWPIASFYDILLTLLLYYNLFQWVTNNIVSDFKNVKLLILFISLVFVHVTSCHKNSNISYNLTRYRFIWNTFIKFPHRLFHSDTICQPHIVESSTCYIVIISYSRMITTVKNVTGLKICLKSYKEEKCIKWVNLVNFKCFEDELLYE